MAKVSFQAKFKAVRAWNRSLKGKPVYCISHPSWELRNARNRLEELGVSAAEMRRIGTKTYPAKHESGLSWVDWGIRQATTESRAFRTGARILREIREGRRETFSLPQLALRRHFKRA